MQQLASSVEKAIIQTTGVMVFIWRQTRIQAYLGSLVPTGYVSSISAETPLQLLNHSCAGLHWGLIIRDRNGQYRPKGPATVLGTCHTAHISEDPC